MESVNTNITVRKAGAHLTSTDWILANPWRWLVAGFVLTLWSYLWTAFFGAEASDYRIVVLTVGLLAGAVGLWLRWNRWHIVYLHQWRAPISLFLGCFFALACIGVTVLFGVSFFAADWPALKPAPLFLVWISTAPPCFVAARQCLNIKPDDPVERDPELEVGLAFAFLAAICVLGSLTLYADPKDPSDWDTMRMFLRVCAAVSMYASALTLSSPALRRLMLSFLFTLHFCGICTAALSANPAPWIVQQTWMRFFRPYLQFVYLNNAYHFYAPDPGPSSYVWFRIIYESPNKDDPDHGMWWKIPQLDDEGRMGHPVALDYQRFLSLTEFVAHPDPPPPEWYYFNPVINRWEGTSEFYVARLNLDLKIPPKVFVLGQEKPKRADPRIPLVAGMSNIQQVFIPNAESRRLLASYARCVAHKFPHPPEKERADWKFKSVKIYRVVHTVPPVQWFLTNIRPTDPELYRPIYVGNFKADGSLIEDLDPYRYWILPSVRNHPNDPDSAIKDYARLHAGDPLWMRNRAKVWVERVPKEEE